MSLPPPMPKIWSGEQKEVFTDFANPAGNTVVEAYAGTGKTTTIKEAFRHAKESRMLYAVFNKRNQREAEEKITDSRVDVKTLHALGFSYIKNRWPKAKPDGDVEYDRATATLTAIGFPPARSPKELVAMLVKLVAFAKNMKINPQANDLVEIMDGFPQYFDIDGAEERLLVQAALKVLEASKVPDLQGRISFDDMVWLPMAMKWVTPRYGRVVIDEAQDMNLPQLLMAVAASSGPVVVVGDRRQAIYAFRGAATNGMSMMKAMLKARELKLTTTYRCPVKVVELAQSVVPEYRAAASAPQGSVELIAFDKAVKMLQQGDSLLSRLNAPLMPLALTLIRSGKPARIEGKDIGKMLGGIVRSLKASSIPDFMKKAQGWLNRQIERLEKLRNPEARIEQAQDTFDTLVALAEGCKGMSEIEGRIESLFGDTNGDSKNMITLSTVHKAKGLEWPRVFMLEYTFRRGKGQEEDNIFYVAVTRSMRELYLVGSGKGDSKPTGSEAGGIVPPIVSQVAADSKLVFTQDVPAADPYDRAPRSFPIVASSIWHLPGNIINFESAEYVCERVNESGAVFKRFGTTTVKRTTAAGKELEFEAKSNKIVHLAGTHERGEVVRRLSRDEYNDFFSGAAGRSKGTTTKTTPANESETEVMAKKTKSNKGIGGSANYARELFESGINKAQFKAKMIAKYPAFEHDEPGIESRWRTAERISKAAAARAKEQTKSKPAKKAVAAKPAKKGSKKSSPPAQKKAAAGSPPPPPPAAAPVSSTPPPPPQPPTA